MRLVTTLTSRKKQKKRFSIKNIFRKFWLSLHFLSDFFTFFKTILNGEHIHAFSVHVTVD